MGVRSRSLPGLHHRNYRIPIAAQRPQSDDCRDERLPPCPHRPNWCSACDRRPEIRWIHDPIRGCGRCGARASSTTGLGSWRQALDEQLVLGIQRVVLGHARARISAVLVVQWLRLEPPVLLEVEGSGSVLAAAVVENAKPSFAGPTHQLPILEIVGSQLTRVGDVASVVGQALRPENRRTDTSRQGFPDGSTTVRISQLVPNTRLSCVK